MKIAVCLWSLVAEGGAPREAVYLAKQLKDNGHAVTFYTFFYNRNNPFVRLLEGVPVKFLYSLDSAKVDEHALVFGTAAKPGNIFGKFLSQMRMTNILSKKMAAMVDPATEIVNVHDKTFKIANYFIQNHPAAKSVWMMNDLPLARWNAERFEIAASWPQRVVRWFADIGEARAMRKLDCIVVLDNLNKAVVQRYLRKDAVVIRSGLDIAEFSGQPKTMHMRGGPFKLLMVGLLAVHRKFEDGIMAAKILRDRGLPITLDIVGPYTAGDPYKRKLDMLIAEHGLQSSVHFTGSVTEQGLVDAYNNHDLFLFPNHNQTWGLSVFEAMAMGLPVIVSRTAGASEMIEQGITGYTVPPKQPQEIADAAERLLKDPGHYADVSQKGFLFAKEHISWEKYTKDMEQAFQQTLTA